MSYAPAGEPALWTESSQGGFRLAVRRWAPASGKPRALVIGQHGGAGFHSGYFNLLGTALADNGIAMTGYDQMGYGYSEGLAPGFVDTIEHITADLQKVAVEEKKYYGGDIKVFALGESMGGFIILHHGLERSAKQLPFDPIEGYIFCGPLVKIKKEMIPPPCVQGIVKFLGRFFPWLKTPGVDITSTFDSAFGDKNWAECAKADPVLRKVIDSPVHFSTACAMFKGMDFVNDEKTQRSFTAPFVIFVGAKEMRVDLGALFEFYMAAGSMDKNLRVIPDGYHQLFQDVPAVTKSVCQEVASWVQARS